MYSTIRVDRRKSQRLQVSLSALCRIAGPSRFLYLLGGKEFESLVIDLSKNGAALLSSHSLPIDTKLFIKMFIVEVTYTGTSEFYEVLTLFANVRYSTHQYEDRYRIGIEFTDIDQDRENKLENIINSSLRHNRIPSSIMPKIII